MPYTIINFHNDFPDEAACLEWLKNRRYPDGIHCPKCNRLTEHTLLKNRRAYLCSSCGNHVYPAAGTIFHKSRTPLKVWFFAIYLVAQSEGNITAKYLERQLGVTYKAAWRMRKLIQEQLYPSD